MHFLATAPTTYLSLLFPISTGKIIFPGSKFQKQLKLRGSGAQTLNISRFRKLPNELYSKKKQKKL